MASVPAKRRKKQKTQDEHIAVLRRFPGIHRLIDDHDLLLAQQVSVIKNLLDKISILR